MKHLI